MSQEPVRQRRRARRGEGDRLRAEIVEAASRMLAESSELGELSLRAVAREVGVAATSIYLHFRDLAELVWAVRARFFEEFGAALESAAVNVSTPADRIRAGARAYVRYGLEHRGEYSVMFYAQTLPAGEIPPAPGGLPGIEVLGVVRDEIAAQIGPGEAAELLALHVWTALHGIVMLRAARPLFPWPEVDREVDDLIDRLLPTAP